MEKICFVIQPFDGGKFDKRYREIFSPAIMEAGFAPYRVDEDPSASIPIDVIERRIRESATCLVDITTDNPNVWFELGMAIAFSKDICIVCSDERTVKYPFDVQHRQIIKYSGESPSDFKKLGKDIVDRLAAISKNLSNVVELAPTNLAPTKGLSTHQIACLGMAASDHSGIAYSYIETLMGKAGYTALASTLAVRQLKNIGLLKEKEFFDDGEHYLGVEPTESGWQWIEDNIQLFDLTKTSRKAQQNAFARDLDDEVPF
jgi:hypothetical protein